MRTALLLAPGIRRRARTSFLTWLAGSAEVAGDDPVATVIDEDMRDLPLIQARHASKHLQPRG